jgi:hypothetical protein
MRSISQLFHFAGGRLFLSDMRPGFSEDGVSITLPAGNYRLTVSPSTGAKFAAFSLVLDGASPDKDAKAGSLSLDMARVGLLDRKAFLRAFAGDAEELFEWSAEVAEGQKRQWSGHIRHKPSGLEALFINVSTDGVCAVYRLRQGAEVVGVRVVPMATVPAKPPPTKEPGKQIFAEVKWRGDSYPWSFSIAEQGLTFAEFLEEVLSEIGVSEREGECLLAEEIDPDAPIVAFRRRYQGIARIQLFVPKPYPQKNTILPATIPTSVLQQSPEFTPRQLARIIYDLLLEA